MNEVQVTGDINWTIDKLERDFPAMANSILYAGASILKEQARENLLSLLPAANTSSNKYNDTLLDAIRNTRGDGNVVKVHTLGTRESGSGTYRTRFYEDSGKERYQKTWKGKPLNKKRRLGALPRLRFFNSAVNTAEAQVMNVMQERLDKFLTQFNTNG